MDKRFILSLLTKTEVGIDEGDIKGAFRLEKWNSDENPQAVPRPVLVQFHNRTVNNLIMENLFKLKHLENKYKGVIIYHDMTKTERHECKSLVEEAKKRLTKTLWETIYTGSGELLGQRRLFGIAVIKYG